MGGGGSQRGSGGKAHLKIQKDGEHHVEARKKNLPPVGIQAYVGRESSSVKKKGGFFTDWF